MNRVFILNALFNDGFEDYVLEGDFQVISAKDELEAKSICRFDAPYSIKPFGFTTRDSGVFLDSLSAI